jgi:hypothetical protein
MIGSISTSVTIDLNYKQYSDIADLHTFQFTVAHALGFPSSLVVFWQRISIQKLTLQITMKSSRHFLFNYTGTSELN